jgi:serine phosphatase RsbU (regulator of sigma subunit)
VFNHAPLKARLRIRSVGLVLLTIGVIATGLVMLVFANHSGPWQLAAALVLSGVGATLLRTPGRSAGSEPPERHVALALLSAFATFASLGTLYLMVFASPPPNFVAGLAALLLGGFFSTLWASAFIFKRLWLIPVAIAAQLFLPRPFFLLLERLGLLQNFGGLGDQTRMGILAFMTIGSVVLGFVLSNRLARKVASESARAKAELDVAQRVHASIVPDLSLSEHGFEIRGVSRPSTEMGGDLIDIVRGPGQIDVILADVSGHGVGAGIVMGMVKGALRTRLRAGADPHEQGLPAVAADLNGVLAGLLEPGMFVTMACARLTPGRAEILGAGHPPVFHYLAAQCRVVRVESASMPAGIDPAEPFSSVSIPLSPGDLVVLYTDGLTEVMDDDGRQLGIEGVEAALLAAAGRPLDKIRSEIFAAARARGSQTDDQSLVLIRAS